MQSHFLQQPAAQILQGKNVTAPAAHKASENQRCQNRQTKKDESRIDESALNRLHRLRRLDGRNRFAHDSPLNEMRDHEKIQDDQCRRAPPAGFGFANPGFVVAGDVLSAIVLAEADQFAADATTFHRVGEFTLKHSVRQRVG